MIVQDSNEENIYNEGEIIRDATVLSSTLYISQAFYIIRGFLIAQLLGPSSYGIWSVIRTFLNSAPYFGLGTQQAMLREVPFSTGEGDKLKKSSLIQTSLSWNVLISAIVMSLVLIASFFGFAAEYRFEIRLSGLLFMLTSVHLFMQPKFNSEQKYLLMSKYLLSYAILNTVLGLSLLFFFKLSGLLMGMILAQLILLTYLIINKHLSLNLSINKEILKELFKIGFPIMILWFIIFLIGNLNKLIVFIMLGKTKAGFYGLAAFVSAIVGYISYAATSVIFPRMMYTYGKTGEKKHMEKYFMKPMIVLSGFIPIILGIIYINIEAIINLFLPQYIPGITVLHILIASLFFSTILGLPVHLLIALNKQKKFMYITAIILFLSIILDLVIIKLGFDINGVAIVTTFTFFLTSVLANGYSLFLFKDGYRQILRKLSFIFMPFLYSFAGMIFIVSISFSGNIFLENILQSLLFIVFNIPLIIYIEKESKIINKILSLLKASK